MAVLSTTLCYPTPANPAKGIFVQRRLVEIARLIPLRVVVPIPWFPLIRPDQNRGPQRALGDPRMECPPVDYEPMFYLPGALKSLDAWHYCRALVRAIHRLCSEGEKIDLIDAHFEWPDGVGAFFAARQLGLPFVCTLRGKLVSQARSSGKLRRIREMLIGADALISVSASLAEQACNIAGKDLHIRVIPNGVDRAIFNYIPNPEPIRDALGWSQEARYVVSVGHLQELKGFHHLFEMWPGVRRRAGDARLVLVGGPAGEPAYETRLQAMIRDPSLEGSVTLVGRLEPARVAALLNAADLFVLASRSEGWCNAIAESLACGCPVVATNVGGNEEVMNHWGLGRLTPYGEWSAFADRVVQCLEEPWDRAKIAEFGGRRSWQQVAAECVEVIGKAQSH
jgi:teichuronic acid biosynthesis glycosyltransferase TuaC